MERKLSCPGPSFLFCPPLTRPHQGVQTTERTEPFREHPPSQTHRLRHTFLLIKKLKSQLIKGKGK